AGGKGTLQFGTELVKADDGSIADLLGASPGASTAVEVMLDFMNHCFPDQIDDWDIKIKEMIPTYGNKLVEHIHFISVIQTTTNKQMISSYYKNLIKHR